jgi:FkbM family methyltransferase
MEGRGSWIGTLLLRIPDSLRSVRKVPLLGDAVHRISHRVLPGNERIWAQIETGPSQGLWMELNARTGQSYFRGDAEAPVQKALAEKLRPGMIFYDLGANIGFFSMLAALAVGPNGVVFSFEPDPGNARRLQRNLERNKLENVTIIRKGVWSTSGRHAFAVADQSSPDRGTGRFVEGEGETSTLLECVAIDDFVQTAPFPDAIKCDVEGAEVEVLRGATKLLTTQRPWIVCEMHSEANGRACRELLREFGYNFEPVDSHHILATPQGV